MHQPLMRWLQALATLGAMTTQGILAWSTFDGALTGDRFLAWLDKEFVPQLHSKQIVVMDNLRVHKVAGVREMIEQAGATLIYLPPYSPEFSPIERMWSWTKSWMRRFGFEIATLSREC